MVQQNIGRARRHGAKSGADDGGHGEIGLDDIALEILVKEIADRHGPEADHVIHGRLAELSEVLAEPHQFGHVARAEARRIGRGAQQQRANEAAVAHDIAGVAVIGLGIAR